jgi:mitogen-activated protein kinase kinase kinase 11
LQLPRAESTKEWHISLDELQFKRRIGQGTAGTTYLAKWSGQTVAVKVACLNEMGLDGWKTKVQSLQRLHHPNVIRLLGSVYNENPLTYCLVLEFCNAGDLSAALQRPTPPNFFFRVAGDIASGLAYLH